MYKKVEMKQKAINHVKIFFGGHLSKKTSMSNAKQQETPNSYSNINRKAGESHLTESNKILNPLSGDENPGTFSPKNLGDNTNNFITIENVPESFEEAVTTPMKRHEFNLIGGNYISSAWKAKEEKMELKR